MKPRLRLTQNHPLDKKYRKLEAFLEEEGIEIENSYGKFFIKDKETGVEAQILDLDSDEPVLTLPNFVESKLIKE